MSKNVFLDIHKDELIAEIRWPNGFKTKEVPKVVAEVKGFLNDANRVLNEKKNGIRRTYEARISKIRAQMDAAMEHFGEKMVETTVIADVASNTVVIPALPKPADVAAWMALYFTNTSADTLDIPTIYQHIHHFAPAVPDAMFRRLIRAVAEYGIGGFSLYGDRMIRYNGAQGQSKATPLRPLVVTHTEHKVA